ncbi:MAG: N-acetylmuramoyl-L-alanine amidase [Akkermansiaceae bacterium]
MPPITHQLYAGHFTGAGKLATSEGEFTLFSSQKDEDAILFSTALEREGQYGIIKAQRENSTLWNCSMVEVLDPISSRLLGRLLEDSPALKGHIISLVRELRNEIIGEPDRELDPAEASLKITASAQKSICALVVGHRKSAKGAQGQLQGNTINEYDYHDELAKMIEAEVKHSEVLIVYRDNTKDGYSKLPSKINALNPDFVVSLHANAHNKKASGTETLYYKGSKQGIKLARFIQPELLNALKLSDRKVKAKIKSDRGGSLLSGTHAPAIIGEPFFIDNPSDLSLAVSKKTTLAKAYARAIDAYSLSLSEGKPSITAQKTNRSQTLKTTLELKHHNLTKSQFLRQNKVSLLELIQGVNSLLLRQYGENFSALTQTDFWVLFNSEAGLRSGKVDIDHRHSEGERGILPLPSNVTFWNGSQAPAWDRPMPVGKNIEHFMIYLGQLKNKKVTQKNNLWLYQGLFQDSRIKGYVLREARVLSGVVHGYFYSGNFKDKQVPAEKILEGFAKDFSIPKIMNNTTYVHAQTAILANREDNINDAIGMV